MLREKAKILLLGSQGNLGTQIAEELNKAGIWKIFPWTRRDCDVTDMVTLEKKIKTLSPDIVINTVAYNIVDACECNLMEQALAITLNVRLVDCLAKICQNINAKFINFSTNYVFSGNKPLYTEDDTPDPVNFYGLSKLIGEKIILEQMKNGLEACIIRVSNLYGPKGSGNSSKPSFFESLAKASESQEFLNVIDDEKNCFTYTKDVAKQLVKMLYANEFNGIYHFVNSTASSWYEAAITYYKLQNIKIDIRPIAGNQLSRKARRPKTAVLISTRTTPMRSFENAIAEYIKENCDIKTTRK